VSLYQIIHYSMQQVFVRSQSLYHLSHQTCPFPLLSAITPFSSAFSAIVTRSPNNVPEIIFWSHHSAGYTDPAMKRPVGLILSAIVLSLVALFLLLTAALMTLAGIFAGHQLSTPAVPHFALYLMIAFSVLYAVLATWAILTVIGIVRLRSWARYSILIIGGGLAVFNILAIAGTVAGALLTRTMLPTLQAQQPPVDPHIMSVVFLVMTAIYLLVAGVGIWWLIYFNLRSTRELFSNQAMLHSPTGSTSTSSSTGRLSQTPTAIKIIGGFFLFSGVTCLLCVFLPFPVFLLGFILPPVAGHVIYLCFALLAAWIGYGLLLLKESARRLTIGFLLFGCCNVVLATLPSYQAQLRLYMTQLAPYIPAMPGQPQMPFSISTIILLSCIWSLIVYGLIFWLLHRHRAAFHAPAPPAPPAAEPMLEA
jgi:hypothetical protein